MTDLDQVDNLRQDAINAALNNNWPEAIALNESILKNNPREIETLNRLARAFMESGLIGKAKTTYRQVLDLDPYNTIASKNIEKLSTLTKSDLERSAKTNGHTPISADLFLEEPGRTKVLELEDLAMSKIIATLHTGDEVSFTNKNNEVIVLSGDKRLGKLPPDYASKIGEALRYGSKFTAIIKSVVVRKGQKVAQVSIFIRETYHSPKLGLTALFPNTNHMTSYVREDTMPLMDTREGLVVEGDDDTMEGGSSTPLPSESEENDTHNEPVLEDEEDFQSN